jgi:hypothetical protein
MTTAMGEIDSVYIDRELPKGDLAAQGPGADVPNLDRPVLRGAYDCVCMAHAARR